MIQTILRIGPDGRLVALVSQNAEPSSTQPGLHETVSRYAPLMVDPDGYIALDRTKEIVLPTVAYPAP